MKSFYVYALVDPATRRPFYVGKGSGNRVHAHRHDRKNLAKAREIDRIGWDRVIKRIVARFDSESGALRYEACLIRNLEGLANVARATDKPRTYSLYTEGFKLMRMIHRAPEERCLAQARKVITLFAGADHFLIDITHAYLKSKGYEVRYA